MSLKEGYKKTSKIVFKAPVREKRGVVVNGIDLLENVPPRTENEVGQRRAAASSPALCPRSSPATISTATGMLGFGERGVPRFYPPFAAFYPRCSTVLAAQGSPPYPRSTPAERRHAPESFA